MSRSIRRVAGVCGALFLTFTLTFTLGCGSRSEDPPDVSAAKVRTEAREAVDATASYTAAQSRVLADRATGLVRDTQRQLVEAREELADLPSEAQAELRAAIDRTERARKALGDELDELEQAGTERWETTRERVSNAIDELNEARREVSGALAGDQPKANPSS